MDEEKHVRPRYNICLVSDFFIPRMGGVEMHQYSLAQCLLRRGHKVIVITGTYEGGRQGVRYLTNGLKVYYCPQMAVIDQVAPHFLFPFFPLFRNILLREQIDIVHGHQTTSMLAHECMMHARTMGYKVVFTDHSLFGFGDLAGIIVNKLMKYTLSDVNHIVCVSHTSKENLVLRGYLDPRAVSVIPNALDTLQFVPDPSKAPDHRERINVVMVSRLVYRKGVDLVVEIIPEICRRHPNVYFIIGGDGVKKLMIEEMRERHQLHDRVELLGAVPHKDVRDVLVRGHIFLNCSLTEAFCIAILEAVSCGLFVVATRVGGVPEVLPEDMCSLGEPNAQAMIDALDAAIPKVGSTDPWAFHNRVQRMYSWHNVAERTEVVYQKVLQLQNQPLFDRLVRYYEVGPVSGILFSATVAVDYLLWRFLEWYSPRSHVDYAVDARKLTSSFLRAKAAKTLRDLELAEGNRRKTHTQGTAVASSSTFDFSNLGSELEIDVEYYDEDFRTFVVDSQSKNGHTLKNSSREVCSDSQCEEQKGDVLKSPLSNHVRNRWHDRKTDLSTDVDTLSLSTHSSTSGSKRSLMRAHADSSTHSSARNRGSSTESKNDATSPLSADSIDAHIRSDVDFVKTTTPTAPSDDTARRRKKGIDDTL